MIDYTLEEKEIKKGIKGNKAMIKSALESIEDCRDEIKDLEKQLKSD